MYLGYELTPGDDGTRKTASSKTAGGYYVMVNGQPDSGPYETVSDAERALTSDVPAGAYMEYRSGDPEEPHVPYTPDQWPQPPALPLTEAKTAAFWATADDFESGPYDTYEEAREAANNHGDQFGVGADVVQSDGPPSSKEKGTVSNLHREAELLQAMALATIPEQLRLAKELDELRAAKRAQAAQDREFDLADAVIAERFTPAGNTHALNSTATDWLDEVETEIEADSEAAREASRAIMAEAALWYERLHQAIKEDPDEYMEQANGQARRHAQKHGAYAPVAERDFLSYAKFINREYLVPKVGEQHQAADGDRSYCRICGRELEMSSYAWYGLSSSSPKRNVGTHVCLPARGVDWPGEYNAQGELVPGTPADGGIYDGAANLISVSSKTAAEGQTCSVCGDSIEKDPASEEPQTWHHNNGEKHDHEAKPAESKEGSRKQAVAIGDVVTLDGQKVKIVNESMDGAKWAVVETNPDGSPVDPGMGSGHWVEKGQVTASKKTAGNPFPVGSPSWFEYQDPAGKFKNDPGQGPSSGVPADLFPEGGVPLHGDLTPEQEAWLKRSSTRKTAERRTLTLPFSEVCMFMGVAGRVMEAERVGPHAVQLFDADGRPFSAPITVGEAGWGMVGFDHSLTDFDESGRWHPKQADSSWTDAAGDWTSFQCVVCGKPATHFAIQDSTYSLRGVYVCSGHVTEMEDGRVTRIAKQPGLPGSSLDIPTPEDEEVWQETTLEGEGPDTTNHHPAPSGAGNQSQGARRQGESSLPPVEVGDEDVWQEVTLPGEGPDTTNHHPEPSVGKDEPEVREARRVAARWLVRGVDRHGRELYSSCSSPSIAQAEATDMRSIGFEPEITVVEAGTGIPGDTSEGPHPMLIAQPAPPRAATRKTARAVSEIAAEIKRIWGSKVNYAAKPYLDAMLSMNSPRDMYGADDGEGIILRFLGNASSFRGEDAKRLKAELKALLKSGAKTAEMQKGAPFAGYEDFDACVAANQDKDDPSAYCGKIKHETEDKRAVKQAGSASWAVCKSCGNEFSSRSTLGAEKCPECGSEDLKRKATRKTAASCYVCGLPVPESDPAFRPEWGDLQAHEECELQDSYYGSKQAAFRQRVQAAMTKEQA